MCGITGVYSTNFGSVEREYFEQLLMLNVWRGKDSTGVIRMNQQGKQHGVSVRRSLLPSPAFVCAPKGIELIHDLDKKEHKDSSKTLGFIGHTRAATKGEVTIQNAHPFRFSNVIGVHNGTIRNAFKGSTGFETDSEGLYNLINEEGIEAALNHVAGSDPAYALVYVDLKERTLNFVKNSRRPLFFTYVYARSTLIWSSQREMIEFVFDRRATQVANEGWDPKDKGDKGFFTLKENDLLSIPLGESPAKAKITKLNVKAPFTVYSGYTSYMSGNNDWWKDYDDKGGSSSDDGYGNFREKLGGERLSGLPWLDDEPEEGQKTDASAAKASSQGAGTATIERPLNHQHRGEPVSTSERNFRLSQGCFCCGTPVSPTDHPAVARVRWWNREHFACGDCYDNTSGDTSWVRDTIDDTVSPPAVVH